MSQEIASAGASELGTTMNQRPLAAIPLTCPVSVSSCGGDTPLHSNPLTGNGASAEHVLDTVQSVADTLGMLPVVGEPADAISGLISAARGDHLGAALSLCALNPVGGQGCGAGKIARRLANARELGIAGERMAGLTGAAKKAIDVDGRKLFPDEVDEVAGVLKESKNVAKQSYTRQLRSYTKYSKDNGFKFELWTRQDTKLSKPLQKAIADGHIIHKCYLGPCL